MSDVYNFTTTENDSYLDRVVAEAHPTTNFIVTTERNTVKGDGTTGIVLIRKDITLAGLIFPDLTLAGRPFGEYALEVLENDITGQDDGSEFSTLFIQGSPEALAEELTRVTNEIRRITNVIEGRTVRVQVQSF